MLKRTEQLQAWLQALFKTNDYELMPASEDASFRSYYRLSMSGKTYIVMDAPPEHEDCRPFIDITNRLIKSGVNVPVIHHENLAQGFLLLTDLGDDLFLEKLNSASVNKLYSDAIKALVQIQTFADTKDLKSYEEGLLQTEMRLFIDWLIETHLAISLSFEQLKELETVFQLLVENALAQPMVFVHRDFHSRNLMLTEKNNPGVIDYQDAVLGPITYDLVSLLKDCYIKWSPENIDAWVTMYIEAFTAANPELNLEKEQFLRWFDLMGVQRHLKASGIFARLFHRDGKQGFLDDIPRTLSYIVDVKHRYPELKPLVRIIEGSVLPRLEEL